MNIVLVEDSDQVCSNLVRLLAARQGYRIVGRARGEDEAVECIRTVLPDMALVDLGLETGSGLNVIRRLRADGNGVRLLVLTNQPEALYKNAALEAGASGYFDKADGLEALFSYLDAWQSQADVNEAERLRALQALARADTGGVLALGYSIMRGYGLIHPTVNELRVGLCEVELVHPVTGAVFSAGRVRVSQCEVIAPDAGKDGYQLGFAATLGWNEVKLIAAATLDLDMAANDGDGHAAHSEEFVLYHTEPVEASGFCIHFKLPHYVTFASSLDNIRKMAAAVGWDEGKGAQQPEADHAAV